jgi:hypothetical protein
MNTATMQTIPNAMDSRNAVFITDHGSTRESRRRARRTLPRVTGAAAVSVARCAGRVAVGGVPTGGAAAVRPAISAAVRICELPGRVGDVSGEAPTSGLGADHWGLVGPAGAGESVGAAPAAAAEAPGAGDPVGAEGGAGTVAAGAAEGAPAAAEAVAAVCPSGAVGEAGAGATPLSDGAGVPCLARGALAVLAGPVPAPVSGLVAVADAAVWAAGRRTPLPCSVEAAVPAVS